MNFFIYSLVCLCSKGSYIAKNVNPDQTAQNNVHPDQTAQNNMDPDQTAQNHMCPDPLGVD